MTPTIAILVVFAIFVVVLAVLAFIVKKKGSANVAQWLLYAVAEAERQYGSSTGALKLRSVYDSFVSKFSILQHFISFDKFSELVDGALTSLNALASENATVAQYIEKK